MFRAINGKLQFSATPNSAGDMLDALVQAATAKCVDFNMTANRKGKKRSPAFILMSNLRGITEDLICLSFLRSLGEKQTTRLIPLILRENVSTGIDAQRRFFETNNPIQPILGSGLSANDAAKRVDQSKRDVKDFWKASGRERTPTVKEMAKAEGLDSTYGFIYFATSNFVHFNPSALLRMGWGLDDGPFTFSIKNSDAYYRHFSSFYGAILFIGFEASFGRDHFTSDVSDEVEKLIDLIGHVHRWPEVITFEEMNEKVPLYFMTHALREVVRKEDLTLPYGAILQEVRRLRN